MKNSTCSSAASRNSRARNSGAASEVERLRRSRASSRRAAALALLVGSDGDPRRGSSGVDGVEHDLRRARRRRCRSRCAARAGAHHLGERPLERGRRRAAAQAVRRRHVVHRPAGLQLLEEPDALLHQRQRRRRRVASRRGIRGGCGEVARRGAVEPLRERRDVGARRRRASARCGPSVAAELARSAARRAASGRRARRSRRGRRAAAARAPPP